MGRPQVTLYGIPNCDTVKKSRTWLAQHEIDVQFFDFKKSGVPETHLQRWIAAAGWQALLNKRGTTWRTLPGTEREAVVDGPSAAALLSAHPTAIKRPVIEWSQAAADVTVGFVPDDWLERLAAAGTS